MALRIEEDLDVPRAVSLGAAQVRHRELVEILFGDEHVDAGVIEVQEVLQVVEVVGGAALFGGGAGQRDAVAFAELQQHLGFERALDVHVELGLGNAADERVHGLVVGHGCLLPHG